MPRKAQGLSAAFVEKAGPGRYGDGGGLYLTVRGPQARWWVFRYQAGGKLREMGLGPAAGRSKVLLADARKKARALLDAVRDGRDPLAEKAAQVAETAKAVTFREAAEQYVDAHRASWRSEKHAHQWPTSLATYAHPIIGDRPLAAIDTADVLKVLTPIWTSKPETAARVRSRVESILDYAKARGWRSGENVARWRGNIDHLLPAARKLRTVKHFAALPYADLPAFMAELRALPGVAPKVLEWTILNASRSAEALGARWDEIDEAAAVWTIPPDRMKARRPHRIPLTPAAMALLDAMKPLRNGEFIFPGAFEGEPLSNVAMLDVLKKMGRNGKVTVHGMRSTFRDYAGNETNFAREIAETALAHAVGDASEQAYRRGDALEKRRRLMETWSDWCDGRVASNVVELRSWA
jgi:integrase